MENQASVSHLEEDGGKMDNISQVREQISLFDFPFREQPAAFSLGFLELTVAYCLN